MKSDNWFVSKKDEKPDFYQGKFNDNNLSQSKTVICTAYNDGAVKSNIKVQSHHFRNSRERSKEITNKAFKPNAK